VRLALIHTVGSLIPVFRALCDELLPNVDLFNMVDESLLQNSIREGRLSPLTARRCVNLIVSAEEAGASVVMVTCSSVGPAVELARSFVQIPVLRVDQPMAERAVRMGNRIGVAATLRTTLEPTAGLIAAQSDLTGKSVEVITRLCEGAFEAVASGFVARHDALVRAGLRALSSQVDVIVLAQASMARVVESLPEEEKTIPILSSPRLAVERLAQMLSSTS
jgi:Asp/Glu/hydantoin racemase